MIRRLGALGVALLVALGLAAVPAQAHPAPATPRPVVFVHGSAGSGQQFQTQAKRFAVNGYPIDLIEAHEYDSTFTLNTMADVWAGLDARIIRLLADLRPAADRPARALARHLRRAGLPQQLTRARGAGGELRQPRRPYGRGAARGCADARDLGGGGPGRTVAGATNATCRNRGTPRPSPRRRASSTATASSPAGRRRPPPSRTEASDPARRAGGALPAERRRLRRSPGGLRTQRLGLRTRRVATVAAQRRRLLRPDHRQGRRPVRVRARSAPARADAPLLLPAVPPHRQPDPVARRARPAAASVRWSRPVTGTRRSWSTATRSGGAAATGSGSTASDILNEATSPRVKRTIGIFAFDAGSDRVTDLSEPLPAFFAQTFITGVDIHIPALRPDHGGEPAARHERCAGHVRDPGLAVQRPPQHSDLRRPHVSDPCGCGGSRARMGSAEARPLAAPATGRQDHSPQLR